MYIKALLKKTAEEIVKRYDSRILTLETQLQMAQQEVLEGHRRRQHLEDELRRTLLKGISAMNLEALSIFQTSASTDSAKAGQCGLQPPVPANSSSANVSAAAMSQFAVSSMSTTFDPPQPRGPAPRPTPPLVEKHPARRLP